MENNPFSVGHQPHGPKSGHVLVGLMVAFATLFATFQFIQMLDTAALVSMGFFNSLFVFLLFPLQGSLRCKISLLLAGNVVGVLWHFLFASFENLFFVITAGNFNIAFLVFSPFANFMWIVSVWSISLSILAKSKSRTNFWGQN